MVLPKSKTSLVRKLESVVPKSESLRIEKLERKCRKLDVRCVKILNFSGIRKLESVVRKSESFHIENWIFVTLIGYRMQFVEIQNWLEIGFRFGGNIHGPWPPPLVRRMAW